MRNLWVSLYMVAPDFLVVTASRVFHAVPSLGVAWTTRINKDEHSANTVFPILGVVYETQDFGDLSGGLG